MSGYQVRVLDRELDELLHLLPAISLEGPKGVGKTATASRRAGTVLAMDDPAQRELLRADPQRLERARPPVLVDEWQREPLVWDAVRRSVDRDATGGRFLLTGSAAPTATPTHSGAGRIVQLRMRPMSLAERAVATPTVSLAELLSGPSTTTAGAAETCCASCRSTTPRRRRSSPPSASCRTSAASPTSQACSSRFLASPCRPRSSWRTSAPDGAR